MIQIGKMKVIQKSILKLSSVLAFSGLKETKKPSYWIGNFSVFSHFIPANKDLAQRFIV